MGQIAAACAPALSLARAHLRPCVKGKFLYLGDEKFYIRGVTYGTFRPDANGDLFPTPEIVAEDFAQIAASGLNAVRTYTVPPQWLLDLALQCGLRVMVGLPWEQHIAFLDDARMADSIVEHVRAGIHACAGHPAILCYVLGNEIPASVVRWHGHRRVERFLERLYRVAKETDPDGLATYVNYPSTEYLRLPFVDFVAFNVYLEQQDRLEAYLARLQNIAGNRPLILAEIGLDSRRHGENRQASTLEQQIRGAFAVGCAGAFVFAWTDEWYRGGHDIDDWDFGLTDRQRHPKPALAAIRSAFAELPFPPDISWPRISVIVCTHNGARTIRECCENLMRLDYPNSEILVVDDGSTDETASIVRACRVRIISTANHGLSRARNTGLAAATGDIVAYLDDDAYPDPHWLTYLAAAFLTTPHAGIGGPNIAPPTDGLVAACIDAAPGNPTHVLVNDRDAEHIPGCNMAFRKQTLVAIDGFDPQFRVAGDDVDVCWRLLGRGLTLGFSPAAVVWHHRRGSIRGYLKQQRGYGKAEALLERKWPTKYDAMGNAAWTGRIYAPFRAPLFRLFGGRIYQGTWGSAPFQFIDSHSPILLWSLLLTPGWFLVAITFAMLSMLGLVWHPLLLTVPLSAAMLLAPVAKAACSGWQASRATLAEARVINLRRWWTTTLLHLLQPAARLYGQTIYGLTPWRHRGIAAFVVPRRRLSTIWSEQWCAVEGRLGEIESALRRAGARVSRGGTYDRWDLEVRGGFVGAARLRALVEEHGGGQQFIRLAYWPRFSLATSVPLLLSAFLGIGAVVSHVVLMCMLFGLIAIMLTMLSVLEASAAMAALARAIRHIQRAPQSVAPVPPLVSDRASSRRRPAPPRMGTNGRVPGGSPAREGLRGRPLEPHSSPGGGSE